MIIVAWLILGAVLLAIELHHLAFFTLFVAIGAFSAAAVALVFPDAFALQFVCAVGASAVGIGAVRPYVSRAFLHRRGDSVAKGVHGGLVGQVVDVLDNVSAQPGGHVRLAGESWLALTVNGEVLSAQSKAIVVAVSGTTLTVSASAADPELNSSTSKMEQLREHFEHIIGNNSDRSGDLRPGADLRPSADDQHRSTG